MHVGVADAAVAHLAARFLFHQIVRQIPEGLLDLLGCHAMPSNVTDVRTIPVEWRKGVHVHSIPKAGRDTRASGQGQAVRGPPAPTPMFLSNPGLAILVEGSHDDHIRHSPRY